jgi:ribosomal protein L24
MKVKKYSDDTFNIIYEINDYAIIQNNPKYGNITEDEGKWGKVIKIMGKPMTAKLTLEGEDGLTEAYVWNVQPTNKNGKVLLKEEIFKIAKVMEMLNLTIVNESNAKIIKFSNI